MIFGANHLRNYIYIYIYINIHSGSALQRLNPLWLVGYIVACSWRFFTILKWHPNTYFDGHINLKKKIVYRSSHTNMIGLTGHPLVVALHLKAAKLDIILTVWPSDAIWRHRSAQTLAQVIGCCLTAPSDYLNLCLLIINEILWHSPNGNGKCSTYVSLITRFRKSLI